MYHRRECSTASGGRNEKWRNQKWNVKTNYLIMKAVWEAFNLNSELNETSKRVEQAQNKRVKKKEKKWCKIHYCCHVVWKGFDKSKEEKIEVMQMLMLARYLSSPIKCLKLSQTRYTCIMLLCSSVCVCVRSSALLSFFILFGKQQPKSLCRLSSLSLRFSPNSRRLDARKTIFIYQFLDRLKT